MIDLKGIFTLSVLVENTVSSSQRNKIRPISHSYLPSKTPTACPCSTPVQNNHMYSNTFVVIHSQQTTQNPKLPSKASYRLSIARKQASLGTLSE
jgi:hypothetical protein